MTQELLETVRESGDTEKVNELIKTYARIAEDEGRLDEAIYWYQQVKEDQYWWSIQLHIAQLFERAGRVAEAETWLNDLPAVTIEERVSVVLARSSLYRNHHELDKARELLEHALSVYPDSAEMLANLAIIDELQDKVEDAIARLRQALALSPNDPYIQNALGYTLVDHETEIDEGAALIAKALEKKPTDGAILDSMGWALYRQGKTEEALPYLRKAMRAHPDPEVAAHLGEVLWQLGKFEEARGVWKNGKSNTAKDALIEKTMQRLNVSESADETPNEPPNTP
jgi:Tfp pilus assembly protein PilF